MNQVIPWETPVRSSGFRSIQLVTLTYSGNSLRLVLAEEDSERHWEVVFQPTQAFRAVTEELSPTIPLSFPSPGGFFEVIDSDWIKALGVDVVHFLAKSRHFVINSYDEVIEVIAWGYSFHGGQVPSFL